MAAKKRRRPKKRVRDEWLRFTTGATSREVNRALRRELRKAEKAGVFGPRRGDAVQTLSVVLSCRAVEYLRQLVELGVYGQTAEEVAARFVERGLQRFLVPVPADRVDRAEF